MSQKSWSNLYSSLHYKMGKDFLVIQYKNGCMDIAKNFATYIGKDIGLDINTTVCPRRLDPFYI